jgi:C4-dicarboxylate transporter DctM subunit
MTGAMLTAALGLMAIFGMIVLHVPVGIAMGVAGTVGFALLSGWMPAFAMMAQEASSTFASPELATIPLFVLMGAFAGAAGLSEDLYRLAYAFIGHRRGGLAMATIGGCAGFGAVCGSSVATAATFGRASLPSMLARRYDPGFAAGTVAAGGTLGILIPPSSIMVIYAVLSQQLIITLYVAALVPSVIAIALHFAAIAVQTRRAPDAAPAGARADAAERRAALVRSIPVLTLATLVIGGMSLGAFTAIEAAAVGAVMAFGFAWGRGALNRESLASALGSTATTTGMIYLLIIGATLFGYFSTVTQAPQAVADAIRDAGIPVWLAMTLLVLLFLVAGAVFDEVAAMVISMPFVLPLVQAWGFDPVWWGIVNVVIIELGMLIPPLGMNVFVLHGIAPQIPLKAIYRGVMPYIVSNLLRLGLLLAFPAIALWLPAALK